MTDLLKPCPFCGEAPRLREASNAPGWWILGCEHKCCGLHPEVQGDSEDGVRTFWNDRPGAPDPAAHAALEAERDEALERADAEREGSRVRHRGEIVALRAEVARLREALDDHLCVAPCSYCAALAANGRNK